MQPPARVTSRRAGAARRLRSEQTGFTIIEVLVAALILAIVSAGAAVAFVGAIGTSGIQRNRTAAEALAQQNASKLRGYTISQLANLNTTLSPVTLDGTQYTVRESANFISDATGTPSCTNPSANYLQTVSTVSWQGEPAGVNPVTVTGLITPTAGQIGTTAGVLAVSVTTPTGTPYAGMSVSVSQVSPGTGSASGVTAANGCVLFADLPTGNYTTSVTPATGSYVDAATDQAVNASSPDTGATNVSAGSSAANAQTFNLLPPGSATFGFTDLWPSGVSPSAAYAPVATSPSVILASGNLTATPGYVVCSNQDSTCPAVGNADTSWGQSAWAGTTLKATPLAPYSYATYPGICQSDDPGSYGGADVTANVTAGGNPSVPLTLPSIVIRLYSGTGLAGVLGLPVVGGSEMAMPAGSKLVVTDTGCGEPYVGGSGVTVPSGDSYLPVSSSPVLNGGTNDTGLLNNPGMPDGKYTVCFQNGTKDVSATLTNSGNGEIVNLYNGSLSTGTCAT